MIKDRMAARPSKTNLRFMQKSSKRSLSEQQRAITAHKALASALPIDHQRIFTKRTIRPAPFAITTTMLEAFVQEEASLTLDRSASRLTIDCRARGHIPSTKLIMGDRIAKIAAAALERGISCVFSNSASELASNRGMREWKRFLGPELGRLPHERVIGSGEGRRCNGVRAAKGNRRATV